MTNDLTINWIEASRANGISFICVSDFRLAQELRIKHLRSGKIAAAASKEAKGAAVLAYGFDELGNVCALLKNGQSRQFFGN
jgi:hypothetical protein